MLFAIVMFGFGLLVFFSFTVAMSSMCLLFVSALIFGRYYKDFDSVSYRSNFVLGIPMSFDILLRCAGQCKRYIENESWLDDFAAYEPSKFFRWVVVIPSKLYFTMIISTLVFFCCVFLNFWFEGETFLRLQ